MISSLIYSLATIFVPIYLDKWLKLDKMSYGIICGIWAAVTTMLFIVYILDMPFAPHEELNNL